MWGVVGNSVWFIIFIHYYISFIYTDIILILPCTHALEKKYFSIENAWHYGLNGVIFDQNAIS